jgi:glycosyltransferase involved in cell wall biosynthesis
MRVVFIHQEIPNKEFNTDTWNAMLLIEAMLDREYEVSVLIVMPEESLIANDSKRAEWLAALESLGISIHVVYDRSSTQQESRKNVQRFIWNLWRIVFPKLRYYFPQIHLSDEIKGIIDPIRPDVIFSWGTYSNIAVTHTLEIAPRFAFVGDPIQFPMLYRNSPPISPKPSLFTKRGWLLKLRMHFYAKYMLELLRGCEAVGASAAHHAEWFREKGVENCTYLPNMIPDWGGEDWKEKRKQQGQNSKFKILLMGHVTATANLSGLHCLADEICPALSERFSDEIEIHICGGGVIPDDLMSRLQYPFIIRRGWVDDIISELLSADVFLVPTPIPLGVRVRIAYTWSLGCCVIAHQVNALGLPEMVHNQNVLLGTNGREMAEQIIRVFENDDLQTQLQLEARKTYETQFSNQVTSDKIFSILEKTASMVS